MQMIVQPNIYNYNAVMELDKNLITVPFIKNEISINNLNTIITSNYKISLMTELPESSNLNVKILNKFIRPFTLLDRNLAETKFLLYNFNRNSIISTPYFNIFLQSVFNAMRPKVLVSKPTLEISPSYIKVKIFFYLLPKLKNRYRFFKKSLKIVKKYNIYTNSLFLFKKYTRVRKNFSSIYKNYSSISIQSIFNRTFKKHIFNTFNTYMSYGFLNSEKYKLNIITQLITLYYTNSVIFSLTKLYYPFYDCNILVNLLGILINNHKLQKLRRLLFRKAFVKNPFKYNRSIKSTKSLSYIRGTVIRVAGHTNSKKIVPRKTVKIIDKGANARGKIHFLDINRFIGTSKRGTYAITMKMSQNIYFSSTARLNQLPPLLRNLELADINKEYVFRYDEKSGPIYFVPADLKETDGVYAILSKAMKENPSLDLNKVLVISNPVVNPVVNPVEDPVEDLDLGEDGGDGGD